MSGDSLFSSMNMMNFKYNPLRIELALYSCDKFYLVMQCYSFNRQLDLILFPYI